MRRYISVPPSIGAFIFYSLLPNQKKINCKIRKTQGEKPCISLPETLYPLLAQSTLLALIYARTHAKRTHAREIYRARHKFIKNASS